VFSLLSSRNRVAAMVNLGARYLAWPRSYNAIVGDVRNPDGGAELGSAGAARQAHGRLRAG
jgi:NADH dehydrogenase